MRGVVRVFGRLAVALVLGALVLALLKAPSILAAGASVTIANFRYTPATVTIGVGEAVTWVMGDDPEQHTVTPDDAGSFAGSGILEAGQSFSASFASAGTYGYHCELHPFMTGTVIVTAALPKPTLTPTPTSTVTPKPTPAITPTPAPTAMPTPAASAAPTSSATTVASPSPPASDASPSERPSPSAIPTIAPAVAGPTPSAQSSGGGGSGEAGVPLAVLAFGGLVIVGGGAVYLVARRR